MKNRKQMGNLQQDIPPKQKIKLYLCGIHPNKELSWEMRYNIAKLREAKGLELIVNLIAAGKFSHRLSRLKKDKLQCEMRDTYLQSVPDGEWLIVLDQDEILLGSYDRIAQVLTLVNSMTEDFNFISIWELKTDGDLKMRPRFIKKRSGISYISDVMKHDWIGYHNEEVCDAYYLYGWGDMYGCKENRCGGDMNYIEVRKKYKLDDKYIAAEFLTFFHNKNGAFIQISLHQKKDEKGNILTPNLPKHYLRLNDQTVIAGLNDITT